jgi:hypothetical protein
VSAWAFLTDWPAWLFIAGVLVVIFVLDGIVRWWRGTAWERRRDDDDDGPMAA